MNRLLTLVTAVSLSACASATLRSDDPRRAVVLAPYMRTVGPFGQINIPEGAVLYPSLIDGQAAWCSTMAVYAVPGERRPLCMFDPTGGDQPEGWLKTAYVPGTISSTRLDVDVPYRVGQTAPLPPRR